MRLIVKLAVSNLRVHKIRAALTIAAIALSVSLVVSVTSGYTSVYEAAHRILSQYMGSTDAQITRSNDRRGGIPQSVVEQIAQDPQVDRVDGRAEIEGHLLDKNGNPVAGRVQLMGILRPQDTRVESLRLEQGKWFDDSDSIDAVIDQVAAERLGNAKIGDKFFVPSLDRQQEFHIVGIVHKPGILAGWVQTAYLPIRTLQRLTQPDRPDTVSRVIIDLRGGTDAAEFVRRWQPKLQQIDPNLSLKLTSDNRKELDKSLSGLQMLSYLGGTVSVVAATFIIFSALSMGVSERQRSLAMLRAIGAYRAQLGRLVVLEAIVLALVGVALGIPLGILWVTLLTLMYSNLFAAGMWLSASGMIYAGSVALLSALAASLLPALSAMRASPLDAMTPLAQPTRMRSVVLSAMVGAMLLCVDPLVVFGSIPKSIQFVGHFFVGLPCVLLGTFLLAPATVWVVEHLFGPLVAAIFGLRFAILRQQLSGGIWRAAGTCAALMVGLAILIVTQTQGTTAIQGWRIPDRFPDIFIYSAVGVTPENEAKLATVPGIRKNEIMPIAIASPQLGSSIFGVTIAAAMLPGATMYFGIDPDKAFDMMDLDFRQGNPQQAKELLKKGRHVVITEEYRRLKGLGVGDKLQLKTTTQGTIDFTVAAVVWSPGIDVITSLYDLGQQLEQRTAASVFGTVDDARQYFGVTRINFYAANLEPAVDKSQVVRQVQKALGSFGLEAGDVRHIKHAIQQTLHRLLLLVGTIAFAALAVASLGVTNTIMASIRSRRWQLGILRSIGVTRSQLLRLVLAEAVLLGMVGIILGLGAGFELAIDARQGWGEFFGFQPKMVIPWGIISIGVATVMLISILASLWPAIHVARSEPLALLQAGRAAV